MAQRDDVFGPSSELLEGNGGVAERAESMLRKARDRAMSSAREVDTRVRGFAGEHPVMTLLMAVGVGYGLGYLIYRRGRSA